MTSSTPTVTSTTRRSTSQKASVNLPGQGATLSDLHLFSHHARPDRYFSLIEKAAGSAGVFILNGDIFDFKWSEHGVFSRSVLAARNYLVDMLERHPECQFIVILGNHDAVPLYIDTLKELEQDHANLEWREFAFVLGDRIFLHGDVIHAGCSNHAIRRFRSRLQRPARGHALQRVMHSAMYRSRLPWAAYRLLPNHVLALRILTYLEHEQYLSGQSVRHIYFGHTHCAFEDFRYRGYCFHNTGAAVHGSSLRVVTFPLEN